MTLTAIVTAHGESPRNILVNLRDQTRQADETILYHSEVPDDVDLLREEFPSVQFIEASFRGDWGHERRALGIEAATSDYIGFFAHDDEYDLAYIEKLMREAEGGADAVYCNWGEADEHRRWQNEMERGFRRGSSTSGNFIIRTDVAREVGWTSREYAADGVFIESARLKLRNLVKIEELLYFHN